MSTPLRKSHNTSLLMYHIVCPAKYRKVVLNPEIDLSLREICLEITKRYEIHFLEIGTDQNHVHFLIQSVPTEEPQRIVRIIKSITAREIFKRHPEVKYHLWGGEFWSNSYWINTVGRNHSENAVREYVRSQGKEKEYNQILKSQGVLF